LQDTVKSCMTFEMMIKILKNIPAFFLLVAGLAICAHLIIPHDHHLSDAYSYQVDKCPASNGKTSHNSGFPVHCHAFNDLASEKATSYVLTKIIQSKNISNDFLPDSFSFELSVSIITIFDIRERFSDSYFVQLSPLRAPPSSS
jgi:hypothetical protein